MNKVEKVKQLAELFDLVQYYYEYRDQPLEESGDFQMKLKNCCTALQIDLDEFKKEFKLSF